MGGACVDALRIAGFDRPAAGEATAAATAMASRWPPWRDPYESIVKTF